MPFNPHTRVPDVDPVDGWTLHRDSMWNPDERDVPLFYAVRGGEAELLRVSSYFFTPTQDRFEWLVRHGFPTGVLGDRGTLGPLCDATIDVGIAADAATTKLETVRAGLKRRLPVAHAAAAVVVLCSVGLVALSVARGLGAVL